VPRLRRLSFVLLAALLILPLAAPAAQAQPGGVIYVRQGATGANDGTSWANAFTDLDAALESAVSGQEIWVAEGTYRPTSNHNIVPSDPRWKHFRLKNGVAVYGGFAGTETTRGARDPVANPVILSGDGGVTGDDSDNCYHVFYHANLPMDNSAVLDGVTITKGRATHYANSNGAGMYNYQSGPLLSNVVFADNKAMHNGAGIYNFISGGLALRDVTFLRNYAGEEGGGFYNTDGNPSLINVSFLGNYGGKGGGLHTAAGAPVIVNAIFSCNRGASGGAAFVAGYDLSTSAQPTFINVTIANNYAQYGGGLYLINTTPVLTNCIIWANDALFTGDQIHAYNNGNPAMTYSVCQGGWAGTGNLSSNPVFVVNPSFGDSDWNTDNDNYGNLRLQATSPCIDAGTNAPYAAGGPAAGVTSDLDWNARIAAAAVDMGAYEYTGAPPAPPSPPAPSPGTTTGGRAFFSPATLNLKSAGKWVKVHIQFPAGQDPRLIDMASLRLLVRGVALSPQPSPVFYGGGAKGVPGLIADFSRPAIVGALDGTTGRVELAITWTCGSSAYSMPAALSVICPGNAR